MNRPRPRPQDDAGLTLVELLVTVLLMGIIGSIGIGVAVSTQRAGETNRVVNDLNEEARLSLTRLSRELREAESIVAVTNPSGPGYQADQDVSVTFEVDFNGNGVIEPSAADPERLTYVWDASAGELMLQASAVSYPVVSGNVEEFRLDLTSRLYSFDGVNSAAGLEGCAVPAGAAKDGIVHWWEVDGYRARGNCNGTPDVELSAVDSVGIELKVLEGSRQQTYRTQVDLRNVTP